MKTIGRYLPPVLILCLSLSGPAAAQKITLAADVWMPYNGDGSLTSGYMVDLARAVFSKKGYTVEYLVLPWTRAKNMAREGMVDGIVAAYKSDAPDFIFPGIEQGLSVNKFFVRKNYDWRFSGLASLKAVNLGIVQGYDYGDADFMAYIRDETNKERVAEASGVDALPQLIKMLLAGRIDAIYEDQYVFDYNLTSLGSVGKSTEAGFLGLPSKVYIAFSPSRKDSKTFAAMLSEGIIELRKSGELKAILAKYGLKDWGP